MRTTWDRRKDRFLEGLSKSYAIAKRCFEFVGQSRAVSWLRSQFPTIPTLLAVILGFGLKAYWDSAEAARLQRVEVHRAARSVAFELQSNLDLVGFDLDYLARDQIGPHVGDANPATIAQTTSYTFRQKLNLNAQLADSQIRRLKPGRLSQI